MNPQYFLNTTDPDYVRYVLSYKNFISETVRLLRVKEKVGQKDIEDMLEFEVEFANVSFYIDSYFYYSHIIYHVTALIFLIIPATVLIMLSHEYVFSLVVVNVKFGNSK